MADIEHPSITATNRTGYPNFREVLAAEMARQKYMEDMYGDEIKCGDTYFINEHDELIHAINLELYVTETLDLTKKTR